MAERYNIVRMYRDHPERDHVVKRGLSLEAAQSHCRRDDTRADDGPLGPWFDGYERARR